MTVLYSDEFLKHSVNCHSRFNSTSDNKKNASDRIGETQDCM